MTRSYDGWYQRILAAEGGYSNNPHDPGGLTIFGISARSAPPALKEKVLSGTLTKSDAINRYRTIHQGLMNKYPILAQLDDGMHFAMLDAEIQGPLAVRHLIGATQAALFGLNKTTPLDDSQVLPTLLAYKASSDRERQIVRNALKEETYSLGHELALRIARVNSKQKKTSPTAMITGMVSRITHRFSFM